ncbi:YwmB family TATA-box binding protein [Paenibacillus sp. YPG26]|uniref:YwmB family TATA-box binding protein n=1 Tax=Paenibacillus sp. YPG26 TaxID=2878915 RepID=UPI0020406637|nr:YwmB family TATA-box binding protein [Paenibacillus sp. YPG26]USB32585.1 YwmB family TATA-box binding protein [Paenibacillus sp. YPG26]
MTKGRGIIVIFIALMVGVLGFDYGNDVSSNNTDYIGNAEKQLDAVLSVGSSVSRERLDTVIKWQGDWNTAYVAEEGAGLIASELGLVKPSAVKVQNHLVYRAAGQVGRVPVKFSVTGREEGLYVVAQLDGSSQGDRRELKLAQSEVGRELSRLGVNIQWSVAVQGSLEGNGIGTPRSTDRNVAKLLSQVEAQAGAFFELRRVEGFQDEYTASESYEVPGFGVTVQSGNAKLGLQMAVHLNSGTGAKELSIGSPILTVEY